MNSISAISVPNQYKKLICFNYPGFLINKTEKKYYCCQARDNRCQGYKSLLIPNKSVRRLGRREFKLSFPGVKWDWNMELSMLLFTIVISIATNPLSYYLNMLFDFVAELSDTHIRWQFWCHYRMLESEIHCPDPYFLLIESTKDHGRQLLLHPVNSSIVISSDQLQREIK